MAPSLAHNQSPATIRKTMSKAYESLGASVPGNVLKGERTLRASGTTAQVFAATKNGASAGSVAQIEIQEIVYAVAVDTSGKVAGVSREGRSVEESEWKSLSFVEELRKGMSASTGQVKQ